jgi:hypothetical protein
MKTLGKPSRLLPFVVALCARPMTCAPQQQSAAELIRFLTFQSERPDKELAQMGIGGCGDAGDLKAATALAQFGASALPEIEEELDAIEKSGGEGFGAYWLERAYARIDGPAAYERLSRMAHDPRFVSDREFGDDSARRSLDGSIALSLGLTSFVSAPSDGRTKNYRQCRAKTNGVLLSPGPCPSDTHAEPILSFHCDRQMEPRDALDQLIRSLERNDDFSFQEGLGPDASAAWKSLIEGTTWKQLREKLLHSASHRNYAVGYQFEPSGRWSEPDRALDGNTGYDRPRNFEKPTLKARFTNASGVACGNYQVKFVRAEASARLPHDTPYLVNNSDLEGLLAVIASCAGSGW